MLERVKRPDGTEIHFEYDALGRRTAKINEATKEITRFVWDGNVPLHEWKYNLSDRPQIVANELGELFLDKKESTENLITWIFDEGRFVPSAKITKEDTFSIVSDYLGTPCLMYNSVGNQVWKRELDIYGNVRVGDNIFVPFLYQGQYYDNETELAYNRFRYYSPQVGTYISQDPIKLNGGITNFYSYVFNTNICLDIYGLMMLFRSVSREEYWDLKNNATWDGKENMQGKWFAENYDDAVTWGHKLGHGTGKNGSVDDIKFYVLSVEVNDDIANNAFRVENLDGVGHGRYIEADELNKPNAANVLQIDSYRVGCN